jgi:F-type H+-transporting ATPase subunit a
MGEETTWFDLLPGVRNLEEFLKHYMRREQLGIQQFPSAFSITHVLSVAMVFLFVLLGAVAFKRAVSRGGEAAIVPPRKFNLRNLFEMFSDAVLSLAEGVMGEKNARKFLPIIGTFACFIFFSNCLALLPGFAPPTATLKTNFALSVTVFLLTHFYGVKEHGLKYFKHFLGPVWWLAPLMLPIELVSHFARPLSLALRLLGNIAADHKVVSAFFALVPLLLPVPFLILGVLVCIVQTLVFCLLSMVYIQGAVAHEGHGDEGDGHGHGHDHDEHAHGEAHAH